MSDKAFQWSLTAATILVLIWVLVGIVVLFIPFLLVIISAIIVEFVVAIILTHFWGKDYMGRRI